MKRRATRVVVFLLLGAIVNVAVACILCLTARFTCQTTSSEDWSWLRSKGYQRGLEEWPVILAQTTSRCRTYGVLYLSYFEEERIDEKALWEHVDRIPSITGDWCFAQRAWAGWPMFAMRGEACDPRALAPRKRTPGLIISRSWDGLPYVETGSSSLKFVPYFELANREFGALSIPVAPAWPGFAINTIFYAAFLWMMFAFPFVVRRRRRIKRNLCPACAYPVGTSPVCTECGAALVKGTSRV